MSFVHTVTYILVNDSFLDQEFFVSILHILQFIYLFFLINDSFVYIERAPL